jgi:hypothetical protein
MSAPVRQSGIQREVMALYRSTLRLALKKDRELTTGSLTLEDASFLALLFNKTSTNGHGSTTSYASEEFKRQAASVRRSEFKKIEYMIRKGEKQLKLLQMPGVSAVHGVTR